MFPIPVKTRRVSLLALCGVLGITVLVLLRIPKSAPQIHVPHPVVDLGTITFDVDQDHTIAFEIANRGGRELIIDRLKAGCPCLEPDLPRSRLLPGQRTTLTLKISPPNHAGPWQEQIVLTSNDPDHPLTRLTMKGFVELKAQAVPALLHVNDLGKHGPEYADLTVYGPTNDSSFAITGACAQSDAVEVHDIRRVQDADANGRAAWELRLLVKPRGQEFWKDTIMVSTNDDVAQRIDVPLNVSEFQPLEVSPRIVAFGKKAGEVPQCTVEIKSRETGYALACQRIEAPEWVDVTEVREGCGPQTVRLQIRPGKLLSPGILRGEIRVWLTGIDPMIRIPLMFLRE